MEVGTTTREIKHHVFHMLLRCEHVAFLLSFLRYSCWGLRATTSLSAIHISHSFLLCASVTTKYIMCACHREVHISGIFLGISRDFLCCLRIQTMA